MHQYAEGFGTFDYSYDYDTRHNVCTGLMDILRKFGMMLLDLSQSIPIPAVQKPLSMIIWMQLVSQMDREGNTTVL